MISLHRRQLLKAGAVGAAALPITRLLAPSAAAQAADAVTIAYNVNLPSWDPTVGLSAVNPTIQSLYKSVFDQYIDQEPDLSFKPGLLTDWGWNEDKTQVHMTVREGALWHDGAPVTAEDVVWSLERAADPEAGNPVQPVWASAGNYTIDGNRITGDVLAYDPTYFKWMAFLTGYVLPRHYVEEVGPDGFEAAPIGSGPYMIDQFERNSFLRLKAFPDYWGGKPAFDTVVFKFVTDATARVAEVESGASDITIEIPYEEFDRLKEVPGLNGTTTPVSDIAMIFINDVEPMTDANVRRAMAHAVDKQLIVDRLLRGYGVPIDTLQTPEYLAFDPSITVAHDPELARSLLAESGYSADNPVRFAIQTTRGFKPKDYEMIQAIVGMWRQVGIEAEIEVYEVAQHFELRARDALAPAAFYNWGNSIGDPATSTGFAMFGPSPHSVWDDETLDGMIGPLWAETDEEARIAGYREVDRYVAENAAVLPLFQYVQPIVYRDGLSVTPHVANFLLPQLMAPAP